MFQTEIEKKIQLSVEVTTCEIWSFAGMFCGKPREAEMRAEEVSPVNTGSLGFNCPWVSPSVTCDISASFY